MAKLDLAAVLAALQMAGAATEAVAKLVQTIKPLFSDADQATLDRALAEAQAENDAGFSRLDAKLGEAESR